ncbi:hypothetical protein [Sansalvadorimonas verongulae]|uniref:hypothetical protein n=1 Tax=Sansalvadorimonas verongulae TaxID=2172824 RepID=UPI0012BD1F9F|nr:hypothetical protein [Sansalvadorimonas verongulae]MTI15106.1 hypothetical protein [Sansalvadorimonas verongulae]
MAGIDGGVGGQPRIQPGSPGSVQSTDQVGKTDGTGKVGSDNLTVSRTEGQQSTTKSSPTAGIPQPNPEAAKYLAGLSPTDLSSLLNGLQAETSQTQDELAISNAEANRAEVKKTQEERKTELEELKHERSEAQSQGKCAKVKLAFANAFSFGIAGAAGYGKQMNAEYDKAMQKVAIIDLQINGLVDTPPPELSPELREVVDEFSSYAPFEQLTDEPRKKTRVLLDKLHTEGRIDDSTYSALNKLVNKHSSSEGNLLTKGGEVEFFKEVVLLQAQLDAGGTASIENLPPLPATPESGVNTVADNGEGDNVTANAAADETTESTWEDNSWLAEFEALMREQEEQMNEIIKDVENAKTAATDANQEAYDIASFRYTSG